MREGHGGERAEREGAVLCWVLLTAREWHAMQRQLAEEREKGSDGRTSV